MSDVHTSEKHNKLPQDYIPSPFTALYLNTDYELSQQSHIQEMLEEIHHIEKQIPGDVDPDYVAFKVKHNDISFVSSGAWLWKVRTYKSYKKTHTNFKEWCNDILHKSYRTALRLIQAATVWIDLATMGFDILPTSISQCLVLKDLDDEELYAAWNQVLDNLEPHQITATSIQILLFGEKEKINTNIKLPINLYQKLWEHAHDAGTTIIQLIASMYYEIYQKVSNVTPEKEQAWRDDLADLIQEYKSS